MGAGNKGGQTELSLNHSDPGGGVGLGGNGGPIELLLLLCLVAPRGSLGAILRQQEENKREPGTATQFMRVSLPAERPSSPECSNLCISHQAMDHISS